MDTLNELFEETLKDVYFAEKAILKALPKMAAKSTSEDLRDAFNEHLKVTEGQVDRLDKVFKLIGQKSSGKECAALKGLVQETEELIKDAKQQSEVLDAGLIGCAQAVEHYEIARYGTLRAWAEQLGLEEAADLLQKTLDEERATDELLTQLSGDLNAEADEVGEEDEDESGVDGAKARSSKSPSSKSSKGLKGSSGGRRMSK